MRKSEWFLGLIYLTVLAVLPLAAHWARSGAGPTCANDGSPIEPLYRVRIVNEGREVVFCCIRCAESWIRKEKATPSAVYVTDESSGEEIAASSAHYVRGLLAINRTTGNRVHAFRTASDAEKQARLAGGHVLEAAERPFTSGACPDCEKCCEPR
jgi:hypothetical protein